MGRLRRKYYERNNFLISSYLYIDRLLDSSLPHSLIQEYNQMNIPQTISEEPTSPCSPDSPSPLYPSTPSADHPSENGHIPVVKVKRTPRAIYQVPTESAPLLGDHSSPPDGPQASAFEHPANRSEASGSHAVAVAIYINLAANTVLLAGKIAVMVLTSSLSVLASSSTPR